MKTVTFDPAKYKLVPKSEDKELPWDVVEYLEQLPGVIEHSGKPAIYFNGQPHYTHPAPLQPSQEPAAIIVSYPDRTEELHWEEGCIDPDLAEIRGEPVIHNLYKQPASQPSAEALVQAAVEAAIKIVEAESIWADPAVQEDVNWALKNRSDRIRALSAQQIIESCKEKS